MVNIDIQDWLDRVKIDEEVGETLKKEQAVPPRPGLVFDRQRHRWVRPDKERPKDFKSPKEDLTSISIPENLKGDKQAEELISVLNEKLKKLKEDESFAPSYLDNYEYDLLMNYSEEYAEQLVPIIVDYYKKALDIGVKSAKDKDRFDKLTFAANKIIHALYYRTRDFHTDSKEVHDLLETCLKKPYEIKGILSPREANRLFDYGAEPRLLREHFNLFSKYASSIKEFSYLFKIRISDALLEKFSKKVDFVMSHLSQDELDEISLENIIESLAYNCKSSQLGTVEGLAHKVSETLRTKFNDEEHSERYNSIFRAIEHRKTLLNKIGLDNLKRYKETGELRLPSGNEFRSKLEEIVDMSVKDPGEDTKEFVSEIMAELGMRDVHELLVREWESSANSLGGNALSKYIAEFYDGEVKYHEFKGPEDVLHAVEQLGMVDFGEEKLTKYIKEHYHLTQEMLKYTFPHTNTITLYRGTSTYESKNIDVIREAWKKRIKSGDQIQVDSNSVSSWTLDKEVARKFANQQEVRGLVLRAEVPLSSIFGYLASYCFRGNEREFLVIKKPKNKYYIEDAWAFHHTEEELYNE